MQHEKSAKSVWGQKNMPPAIIPEKAINLHTLEDAGIYIYMCIYIYIYTIVQLISRYNHCLDFSHDTRVKGVRWNS